MSFGEQLKDQLPVVNNFTVAGLNFCSEVRDFLKERAHIEKEYAHKLEHLNKRYSKQKDKFAASLIASTPLSAHSAQSIDRSSPDDNLEAFKFGTLYKAWDDFLKQNEEMAESRIVLAEKIISEITDPLKTLIHKKEEARRKHVSFAQKIIDERNKTFAEKDKLKQKYDEICDTVENSKQKYEKATDEKTKERLKKQWASDIMEMNNIKNNYVISLHAANAAKKAFYFKSMPSVMDMLQELNERRIVQLRQICIDYLKLEQNSAEQGLNSLSKIMEGILSIDSTHDIKTFLDMHNQEWLEPYDFKFEPTLLWKDTDVMATDEQAKIFLSNRSAKLEERLLEVEGEIALKSKELAGLNNLFDAYRKNSALGNADDVNENMIDAKRALILFDEQKSKIQVSLQIIKTAVGDGTNGKRHTLMKAAFAIPSVCDFCKEKIWGLTQPGMTCKECGYNCHIKCEMKVPPYCSQVPKGHSRKNSNINISQTSPAAQSLPPQNTSLNLSQAPESSSKTASRLNSVHVKSPSIYNTPPTEAPPTGLVHSESKKSAKALYDYTAENPDELTIIANAELFLVGKDDGSGWVKAEFNGTTGLVPANYIQTLNESLNEQVRAMYEYSPQQPDELTLKEGDIINLVAKPDGGWWEGILNGKRGQFPSSYVEPLKK